MTAVNRRSRADELWNDDATPPLCPARSSTAICSGLPVHRGRAHLVSHERATEARKQADRLACAAWNKRMLGFQGPAQGLPDTKVGTLTQALYDEAKKINWTVIGMKNDSKKIFSFE